MQLNPGINVYNSQQKRVCCISSDRPIYSGSITLFKRELNSSGTICVLRGHLSLFQTDQVDCFNAIDCNSCAIICPINITYICAGAYRLSAYNHVIHFVIFIQNWIRAFGGKKIKKKAILLRNFKCI